MLTITLHLGIFQPAKWGIVNRRKLGNIQPALTIGQQRADHSSLWSAAIVVLASAQPLLPLLVPFLDRHLQPHLQQMQQVLIDDFPRHTLHQLGMRNRIEGNHHTLPNISSFLNV
jgi:hypothetical protein